MISTTNKQPIMPKLSRKTLRLGLNEQSLYMTVENFISIQRTQQDPVESRILPPFPFFLHFCLETDLSQCPRKFTDPEYSIVNEAISNKTAAIKIVLLTGCHSKLI